MTKTSYKIMFGLQVFHNFFNDNLCSCLTYELGNNSKSLSERFGYKMSFSTNGFVFLSNSSESIKEHINYLKTITTNHYFDFLAYSKDFSFYSFTDFPINWKGSVTFNSQKKSKSITSKEVVLKPILDTPNNSNILFNLKIHFDDLIKLYIPSEITEFQIRFKSRATQWQYFIVNRSSMELVNPEIVGASGDKFIKNENVQLPNGEEALLFFSSENIPLCEIPKQKYNLIVKSDVVLNNNNQTMSRTKTIMSDLPNPSPDKLSLKVTNDQYMVSSPMYLYI